MSDELASLLNELRRLERATATGRGDTLALIDDVRQLRQRLIAARDGLGVEIDTVQRGIAAFNAYGQVARRPR